VATASTQGPETGAFLAANHEDAFLAPPRDHRDRFVQHVRALAASPERRHELGRNGQSLYENHFSWPIVADHLLDALNATSTAVQAAYSE
jgi:glycosyltransferase involved in cell wall biosynthesis